MLSLTDLLHFAELKNIPLEKRRAVVREYLQTLLLFYLQKTTYAAKLIFIGGTALRFFYNLQRFSEDLDFNYLGTMTEKTLMGLMTELKRNLQTEGIKVEHTIRKSRETYFHWKIYLQFPEILQLYQCAGRVISSLHPREKLSIQIDIQNLAKTSYPVDKKIIAHFGQRFIFSTTGLDMFLAEKSNAMLFRDPSRGRDFFDYMSLIEWGAKINLDYMKNRDVMVETKEDYKNKIIQKIGQLPFDKLTTQLRPFLFRNEDVAIMENFPDYSPKLLEKIV